MRPGALTLGVMTQLLMAGGIDQMRLRVSCRHKWKQAVESRMAGGYILDASLVSLANPVA